MQLRNVSRQESNQHDYGRSQGNSSGHCKTNRNSGNMSEACEGAVIEDMTDEETPGVRTEHFCVCKSFTGTQDPYRAGMAGAWKYCGNDGRRSE